MPMSRACPDGWACAGNFGQNITRPDAFRWASQLSRDRVACTLMEESNTSRIKDYCGRLGIEIPAGFHRQPAARYALVDLSATPPKLIARTWFKHDGVISYLSQYGGDRKFRILDFKDRVELQLLPDDVLAPGDGI
jgi:hypothetical protein